MALGGPLLLVLATLGQTAEGPANDVPPPVELIPPKPIFAEIPYPADAPLTTEAPDVTVLLRVDEQGEVVEVRLLKGVGPPFDAAVLAGATLFRFEPATYGGERVEVEITYTQRFVPPEISTTADAGGTEIVVDAALSGVVVERGTRRPVANATVVARLGADSFPTTTDQDGKFNLAVPAGLVDVRVLATDYLAFKQQERLAPQDQVKVKYLLDRASYSPYETLVVGQRERLEVSRTSLRDREIKQIPGTFGDPFRVVTALPGVSSMMGLITLPVVRGASPGSTAFLLDGVRLPMLFHFLAGPSVIHPEFIDRVDFYAGGFRVNYGGYTAGIIDGITRPAHKDERTYEVDLANTQTGLFLRDTVGPVTATVAGRYGFPGLLMKLMKLDVSLSYWDYQTRVDYGTPDNGLSLFIFGAADHVTETTTKTTTTPQSFPTDPECQSNCYVTKTTTTTETLVKLQFHRADLLGRRTWGDLKLEGGVSLGYEQSNFGGDGFETHSTIVAPRVYLTKDVAPDVTLHAGLEGSVKPIEFRVHQSTNNNNGATPNGPDGGGGQDPQDRTIIMDGGTMYTGGAFLEALWRPQAGLLIIPGARFDIYNHKHNQPWNIDPRLVGRYRLREADNIAGETWLKGAVGWYHQPPRLFLPIPGLAESALDKGLLGAIHNVIGLEHDFGQGFEVDLQTYFNWLYPVFFEPQMIAGPPADPLTPGPSSPPGQPPGDNPVGNSYFDNGKDDSGLSMDPHGRGRAFGLEIMLRRRAVGRVFGWLAYSISQSDRRRDGHWVRFDYDRTHIVNVVAGVALPRNWEAGARVLLQSGTPLTTAHGVNSGRSDWQVRFDVRFDKRAVWNNWMLDFYVDIINLAVAPESGGIIGGSAIRYLVPTVGFRGVF
jgi:TonB family protein